MNEYDEERCLNCGYRTAFVPPPSAMYRALPVIGPSCTPEAQHQSGEKMRAYWRKRKRLQKALNTDAQEDARLERQRIYMRAYRRGIRRRERASEVTC